MAFQSTKDKTNHQLKKEKTEHSDLLNENIIINKPFNFNTNFQGYMEMYCPCDRVEKYLNRHQDWFKDCAKPMKAIPLGDNGYTLTVGRFGSFGYEVEAKIDVVMRSLGRGKYVMQTVNIAEYQSPGYKVDYQAVLQLSEINTNSVAAIINNKKLISQLSDRITRVEWELNLAVAVKFPKFIHKLPSPLIQTTGDRLLTQIVKQVSPLLSSKVQKHFHSSHNLPIPGKNSRNCQKLKGKRQKARGNSSIGWKG